MNICEKVDLIFIPSDDGTVRVEARRGEERVGLTPEQVMGLFGKSGSEMYGDVAKHLKGGHSREPHVIEKGVAGVHQGSTNEEKVALFVSLFRGREDVYARRWENRDGTKSGYAPVCRNEWVAGVCGKPHAKCVECKARDYVAFDVRVAARHLAGKEVAGVYPMRADETCRFLAIDFDGAGWKRDAAAVRSVCERKKIPVAVERSRSGNGAHLWFFFDAPIPAVLARKLGTRLLTAAMEECPGLAFKSYDRLFPSQDVLPKGGFGNLIALPLQHGARSKGNSVFVDENFAPHPDPWAFLSGVGRMGLEEVERAVSCEPGGELGPLHRAEDEDDEEHAAAPWQGRTLATSLGVGDFSAGLRVVEANMIFVEKAGVSHRALNRLKRLAAFKNPEFYKAQAMRLPTWNKPRVISVSEETERFLCLPRGCKGEVLELAGPMVEVAWRDERNAGKELDAAFNGVLREEQAKALEALLAQDNGVLSATTAFGKTVVAAALIAARKVNTLVLVNRRPLLDQWKARLSEFLVLKEGVKIGLLGGGGNTLGGEVDIAAMQSLARGGEAGDVAREYGMVIVDECHHVSAVSFERVLKKVNARFVHGLTATPKRRDGHDPIITLHCGAVRYKDDARAQAQRRPFGHVVIPRFTAFRVPLEKDDAAPAIQDLYAAICQDEARNGLIVADVLAAVAEGRNALVLTERKSHVEALAEALRGRAAHVLVFVGGQSAKARKALVARVEAVPPGEALVIVATGKYVGEGFDVPRLDTLFLAMPVAWQGTLAQYAGRLHRLHEGKREARVYDYVDARVAVFDRMHAKRVKGYAAMGYQTRGGAGFPDTGNIIFDGANFLPVFTADVASAKRAVVVASPFVARRRTEAGRNSVSTHPMRPQAHRARPVPGRWPISPAMPRCPRRNRPFS